MALKGTITLKASVHEAALLLQNLPPVSNIGCTININYDLTGLTPEQQKLYEGVFTRFQEKPAN